MSFSSVDNTGTHADVWGLCGVLLDNHQDFRVLVDIRMKIAFGPLGLINKSSAFPLHVIVVVSWCYSQCQLLEGYQCGWKLEVVGGPIRKGSI